MAARTLADQVVTWQRVHGRHDLPWQGVRDPYRVWLSEIMLQQTQVATVRDYFARFLERFPDLATLAAASLDDVLGLLAEEFTQIGGLLECETPRGVAAASTK